MHSAWSQERSAQEMADILSAESETPLAHVKTLTIDPKAPDGIACEVLVNLNTGEQAQDETIGLNHRRVVYEELPRANEYNFVMYDDESRASLPGENPRKVDGRWVIFHVEGTWKDSLIDPDHEILDECLVVSLATTFEEAFRLAEEKRLEILETLEKKHGSNVPQD